MVIRALDGAGGTEGSEPGRGLCAEDATGSEDGGRATSQEMRAASRNQKTPENRFSPKSFQKGHSKGTQPCLVLSQ